MCTTRIFTLFTWLTVVGATVAPGATITVGTGAGFDYATIQAAIDAAVDGDTVIVHPGTYLENIRFKGKNIILRSTNPTDPAVVAATIIDGNREGSVVTLAGAESTSCVLAGFTIRNGKAAGPDAGGGIDGGTETSQTLARIEFNVITGNSATRCGGLAYCGGVIQYNTIKENQSESEGGGLLHCSGTIRGNTITGNTGSNGGGLSRCDGLIELNVIASNQGSHGAGLAWCNGTVQNNAITSNTARGNGGALDHCSGIIRNNRVTGNRAVVRGGGLNECQGLIRNNTIANNRAKYAGGMYECTHRIENCIVWGNTATTGPQQLDDLTTPTYSCIEGWTRGGPGNISADPLFVDPDGPDDDPLTDADNDYHLTAGSPCIDTGKLVYWSQWPIRDLVGFSRLAGPGVDMGCHEFGSAGDEDGDLLADADETARGTDPGKADTDGDFVVDGLEILRGSDPTVFTPSTVIAVPADSSTIQEAIDRAWPGDEVIVSPGVYLENVQMHGKDIVLRSTDPTDTATVAATVIDGSFAGRVVSFDGTETERCVLSGFTIRNGLILPRWFYEDADGGGISGGGGYVHTRARIEYNVITGNACPEGAGGGLAFCGGLIRANSVIDNLAEWGGGGLYSCHGTIRENVITSNTSGALAFCGGTIEHNSITANRGDAVIFCHGLIRNNTITDHSAGALRNCDGVIQNNTIARQTWWEAISGCDGTIEGNTIVDNLNGGLVGCNGIIRGNFIARNGSRPALRLCNGLIQDNVITENRAIGLAECNGTIRDNLITSNSTGLIRCNGIIFNNTIALNSASVLGGGLYACNGEIRNNTIVANRTGGTGGGLSRCEGTIVDCIIWDNEAPADPQIHESAEPAYSCIEGWTGGTGNISADPLFVAGPFGEYYLSQTAAGQAVQSPCVDAGSRAALAAGLTDRSTRTDGVNDTGRVDMGRHYPFRSAVYPLDDASPLQFSITAYQDSAPVVLPLRIRNVGAGTSIYTITTDSPDLIEVAPGAGQSSGETHMHDVTFKVPGLAPGTHEGTITIEGNARNSPVSIPVAVTITPVLPGVLLVGTGYGYPFASVQDAVDAARPGDTVVLWPGTYFENVHFHGKDITLRSIDPDDRDSVTSTILDGTARRWAVQFSGTETDACVLSGLTIRNGASDGGAEEGGILGGSETTRTLARIENNIITENAGFAIRYCNGSIQDNEIIRNAGGLIQCDGPIQRNRIARNYNSGLRFCNGVIQNNAITGNTAPGYFDGFASFYYGGGLYDCDGIIRNNIIAGNSAGGSRVSYSPTVNDSGEDTESMPIRFGFGGGLALCNGSIENNTIADNLSATAGSALWSCSGPVNSIIKGGMADTSPPTYCCIPGWTGGGEGNISDDPLLVSASAYDPGYRLSADSPCIDAGNPDPAFNDAFRPPGLGAERNDMGAYGGPYNGGWAGRLPTRPDLTGGLRGINPLLPALTGGQPVDLAATVTNLGGSATTSPFWIEFWVVNEETEYRGYLCDSFLAGPLQVGKTYSTLDTRFVNEDIPSGFYTIEMRIDATDAVVETNEANNVSRLEDIEIESNRPNLIVESADFAPEQIEAGPETTMSFRGRIRNAGLQPVTGDFWVEIFVWPDRPDGYLSPVFLCDSYRIVQDLQPGESIDLATLPPREAYLLEPGVYRVAVAVDRPNAVDEQHEDDNVGLVLGRKLRVWSVRAKAKRWEYYD